MPLRISTLSVMVGSPACNLKCPFCISKQTWRVKHPQKTRIPLERIAFLADKFLRVADGLPYGIITGKGEPTLTGMEEVGAIVDILANLHGKGRGLIPELQTNGVLLNRENMQYWKDRGLNTIALSCVSHLDEINSKILSGGKVKWSLGQIVQEASESGLLVRLTAVMTKGGIDSPDALLAFLKWAKETGGHQVTLRKMGKPRDLARPGSQVVADWIDRNFIPPDLVIKALEESGAKEIDSLPWGIKYSYEGLSVAVTETMTPPKDGLIRSAVIQPDGHLYGSWDDPADIII